MKKRILIGVGCLVVAIAIFCGGFILGIKFNPFSRVTNAYVEMLPTLTAIRQADREDYAALKTSLNLKLDGDILKLNYLIQDAKEGKDVEKAKSVLKLIAEHRQKYPPVYNAYISLKDPAVKKAVDDVLARYMR